jgi:solute carrier family 25 (mitochondrial phosphate transporter), member 23/24/25/41
MWRHGKIRAFYRGLTLGLLGIVPYSAIDLGCFEGMKRAYKKTTMQKSNCSEEDAEPGIPIFTMALIIGNVAVLCMGAISGSIGASAVFPLNVLVRFACISAHY